MWTELIMTVVVFIFMLCIMLIIYLVASKQHDERFDEKWRIIEEDYFRGVKQIRDAQKRKEAEKYRVD